MAAAAVALATMLVLGLSLPAGAGEAPGGASQGEAADSTLFYRTREERREAGLRTELTPWLTASGLLELEAYRDSRNLREGGDDDIAREDTANLQLGLEFDFGEFLGAEVILEYDSSQGGVDADEAFMTLEYEDWELSVGRQYTPLGVYASYFINGPSLEFGETRADEMLLLTYGPNDAVDITAGIYEGVASPIGEDEDWDWAVGAELAFGDHWSGGLSYQSDLADSDERLLEDDGNRYARRVSGAGAFLRWSGERNDVTFEYLGATRPFEELESDRDRPSAWNVEALHDFPDYDLSVAARLEGSRELEGEPRQRWGVAATWRFLPHASLSIEYLRGRYERGLAVSDDDEDYDRLDQFAARLSYEF